MVRQFKANELQLFVLANQLGSFLLDFKFILSFREKHRLCKLSSQTIFTFFLPSYLLPFLPNSELYPQFFALDLSRCHVNLSIVFWVLRMLHKKWSFPLRIAQICRKVKKIEELLKKSLMEN